MLYGCYKLSCLIQQSFLKTLFFSTIRIKIHKKYCGYNIAVITTIKITQRVIKEVKRMNWNCNDIFNRHCMRGHENKRQPNTEEN